MSNSKVAKEVKKAVSEEKTCPFHANTHTHHGHIKGILVPLGLGIAAGAPFGYSLSKTGLSDKGAIRNLAKLTDFGPLSVLLAGAAGSALSFAVLNLANVAVPAIAPTNLAAAVSGGLVMGVGMYVSDTCPGTSYVAFGNCVKTALSTFGGLLLGTVLFGETKALLPAALTDSGSVWTLFPGSPAVSIAVAAALGAVSFGVAKFAGKVPAQFVGSAQSWSAAAGASQLLSVGLLGIPLGTFQGTAAFASQLTAPFLRKNEFLKSVRCGHNAIRALFFNAGILVGAHRSFHESHPGCCKKTAEKTDCKCTDCKCEPGKGCGCHHKPKINVPALVGGVLLGFGSALAKGDTYFHLFTGIPQLSVGSVATIGAALAGAVVTGAVLKN